MRYRSFANWAAIAALPWLLFGCSSSTVEVSMRPDRFPAKGQVTYNGKPATGATVTLWKVPLDQDGKNAWRQVKPAGLVGDDGAFSLNSYDANDGAMAGEYVVTVSWAGPGRIPGDDLLQGRHGNPDTPVAMVTIKKGDNQLPPIALTGPPIELKNDSASGDL